MNLLKELYKITIIMYFTIIIHLYLYSKVFRLVKVTVLFMCFWSQFTVCSIFCHEHVILNYITNILNIF